MGPDGLQIHERSSPNFGDRKGGDRIDYVVLHYTGMATHKAALERLCDPAAQVSAHYLIDEDGTLYRLVPEEKRAWHAGVSCWRGERDLNSRSIGIELTNPGHEGGYRAFPDPQLTVLFHLLGDLFKRYRLPPEALLAHSDIAPSRKMDPGELFPWAQAAALGFGYFLNPDAGGEEGDGVVLAHVQSSLADLGYDIAPTGASDEITRDTLIAFQRRFRPGRIEPAIDPALAGLIQRHAALWGQSTRSP